MKDVGEYFDDLEALWADRDVSAEAIEDYIFAYDEEAEPRGTRGRVLARIAFPGQPDAYLKVDEWLVAIGDTHIRRESYVYELVFEGAVLEDWHRHLDAGGGGDPAHAADHQHRGGDRLVTKRVTHGEALDACLEILWRGDVDGP
jgi:hypothetical protein